MTNRERIHRVFDAVQSDAPILLEEPRDKRHISPRSAFLLAAALLMILIGFTSAYAGNNGIVRDTVTMWVCGVQKEVEVEKLPDGLIRWTDENGQSHGMRRETIDQGPAVGITDAERTFLGRPVFIDDITFPGKVYLAFYEHYIDITEALESAKEYRDRLYHGNAGYFVKVVQLAEGGFNIYYSTHRIQ